MTLSIPATALTITGTAPNVTRPIDGLCAMRANRLVDPKPKSEFPQKAALLERRCSPAAVGSLIVLMDTFGSRPRRYTGQGRKGGRNGYTLAPAERVVALPSDQPSGHS